MVREAFKEKPVLIEIARCESTYRHSLPTGTLLRGVVNARDVGVMQINEKYHLESAKKLGLDIHTLAGNIVYAMWLYDREGTKPWSASKGCWGSALAML